jgi:hypothetical protein
MRRGDVIHVTARDGGMMLWVANVTPDSVRVLTMARTAIEEPTS